MTPSNPKPSPLAIVREAAKPIIAALEELEYHNELSPTVYSSFSISITDAQALRNAFATLEPDLVAREAGGKEGKRYDLNSGPCPTCGFQIMQTQARPFAIEEVTGLPSVNMPWERIPQHAADLGYGPVPPEPNVVELHQTAAQPALSPTPSTAAAMREAAARVKSALRSIAYGQEIHLEGHTEVVDIADPSNLAESVLLDFSVLERALPLPSPSDEGRERGDPSAKPSEMPHAIFEAKRLAERRSKEFDANVNRLKACEHIAAGDEGWERLRNECPSTAAVARLRDERDSLCAQVTELTHERDAARDQVLNELCEYLRSMYAIDAAGKAASDKPEEPK